MTTKGHIFYVIGTTDLGGAEMHLLRISAALVQRGWHITVFCLGSEGTLSPAFRDAGVKLIHPLTPACSSGLLRKPLRLIQLLVASLQLLGIFLFKRPPIVHFFLPAAYLIAGPLAVLCGSKIRLMSRRSRNHYQQKSALFSKIERKLHQKMTMILGNSQKVMADLIDDEDVPKEKTQLIYNGIQITPYQNSKTGPNNIHDELDINKDTCILSLVANLIPYKGHLDLIQALGLIKSELTHDWALVCAGYDSGHGVALNEAVTAHGLDQHIHFIGQRRDIPEILKASDIGLLCSHEEGFSNAVLEAMASSLPMVVTDVGGNAEAVIEGKGGYVVPAHNPDALSKALLKLISNPEDRMQMGAFNAKRVADHFTLDHCVDQYEELYQKLINKPS